MVPHQCGCVRGEECWGGAWEGEGLRGGCTAWPGMGSSRQALGFVALWGRAGPCMRQTEGTGHCLLLSWAVKWIERHKWAWRARENSAGKRNPPSLTAWSRSSLIQLPGIKAFLVLSSHIFKQFPAPLLLPVPCLALQTKHPISMWSLAPRPLLAMAVRADRHAQPLHGKQGLLLP